MATTVRERTKVARATATGATRTTATPVTRMRPNGDKDTANGYSKSNDKATTKSTYAYATLRQSVAGNSTFRGIFYCNLGTPKPEISKFVTTQQIDTPYSSPCNYVSVVNPAETIAAGDIVVLGTPPFRRRQHRDTLLSDHRVVVLSTQVAWQATAADMVLTWSGSGGVITETEGKGPLM